MVGSEKFGVTENEQEPAENEQNGDQEATTSKPRTFNDDPEYKDDNVTDLRIIDVNSADAVRQAMKAIKNYNKPPTFTSEFKQGEMGSEHLINTAKTATKGLVISKSTTNSYKHKSKKKQSRQMSGVRKQRALRIDERRGRMIRKEKRRMKKTVSSMYIGKFRKEKRHMDNRISSMYVGKLRNVVPFQQQHRKHKDSDSDMDLH